MPGKLLILLTGVAVAAVCVSYLEYSRRRALSVYPEWPWWFLVGLASVLLVAVAVVFRSPEPRVMGKAVLAGVVGAAVLLLGIVNLGKALYQRGQPGSVRYFPGERDERVTVEKVRELLLSHAAEGKALLISGKDIGYEVGVRYYEDDFYLPYPDRLARLFRPGMLMVTRDDYDFSQDVFPAAFRRLARIAHPIWVSPTGTFTIWRRDVKVGKTS